MTRGHCYIIQVRTGDWKKLGVLSVYLCLVANLLFKMSSTEAKKNSAVNCSVAFAILCGYKYWQ